MPRRARLKFAGVPLHIIQRGNNRIACFFAEEALVTPHDGYNALGETSEQRTAAYRRLFQFELDEEVLKEIRSAANGGFALGDRRFKEELSVMLGRRVERLRQRLRQRASQAG